MKKMHILALLLALLGLVSVTLLISKTESYQTFAKARQLPKGKIVTLIGTLDRPDDMYYNPEEDANRFIFYLKDLDGKTMKVVYSGSKPIDFERSEQITLTGKIKDEEFYATKILLKCPSKYVEDDITEML